MTPEPHIREGHHPSNTSEKTALWPIIDPSGDTQYKGCRMTYGENAGKLDLVCYEDTKLALEKGADKDELVSFYMDVVEIQSTDNKKLIDHVPIPEELLDETVDALRQAKVRRGKWLDRDRERADSSFETELGPPHDSPDTGDGGRLCLRSEGHLLSCIICELDDEDIFRRGVSIRGRHLSQFIGAFEDAQETL